MGGWQQYNLRYICTGRKLLSPLGENQKIQESNSELVLATMGKKKITNDDKASLWKKEHCLADSVWTP